MFSIDEFKQAASEEIRVLRHLAGKVDAAQLDWRPSPAQRTIQETMQYLAFCVAGPAKALVAGDWSQAGAQIESFAGLSADGFKSALDAQEKELHGVLDSIPAADLGGRQVELPWGVSTSLGDALYGTSLRFLTAYRMQLFLFIKASGQADLSTHDAWLGMDKPTEVKA